MYYLIQWTWGILANILGAIIFLFAAAAKWPIQRYRRAVQILVPWNFGGLSLGMFILRGAANDSVLPHEYGHTIQNLRFGPLYLFAIGIPSAIRYWKREFTKDKSNLPLYDSIWFEGQATKLGIMAQSGKWNWL